MEVVRHTSRPPHGDGFREKRIDAPHPAFGRALRFTRKAHHLMRRMHARIGAASADDADGMVCKVRERFFKRRLHARPVGLHLPAVEGRAAVFNAERIGARGHAFALPRRSRS